MGRKIKTILPTAPGNLKPKLANFAKVLQREKHVWHQTKQNYDLRKRAKFINLWKREIDLQTDGHIVKYALYPRSYIVDTPNGTVRRNR